MRRANPSAIADLPTPGSPINIGLFFFRRDKICETRSISFSRPTTGSSLLSSANLVKSLPKLSSTGVLDFLDCVPFFSDLKSLESRLSKSSSSSFLDKFSTLKGCSILESDARSSN